MSEALIDLSPKSKPLFTRNALLIAAAIGGSLGISMALAVNYKNSVNKRNTSIALGLSLSVFLAITSTLLILPQDHFLHQVNDMVYNVGMFAAELIILQFTVTDELKNHVANEGETLGKWRAAGLGAISGVVVVLGLLAYNQLFLMSFDSEKFYQVMDEYSQNENLALQLFPKLEAGQYIPASHFIESEGLPAWEKNLILTDTIAAIEGLPQSYSDYNDLLREYTALRISSYSIIKSYLHQPTFELKTQIDTMTLDIELLLEEMKNISL